MAGRRRSGGFSRNMPAGNAWMLLAPFTFMEQAAARFQMLGFQEIHRCIPREQVEHLALDLWKGEGT